MDTLNNLPSRFGARPFRFAALLAALITMVPLAGRAVDLADQPVFLKNNVPGNVLLALSVEFPTALSPAYYTDYSALNAYIGYFDPEKCYRYIYDASKPEESYFAPDSKASGRACSSSAAKALWSGNFLNWASMGALDAFRKGMTGGHRAVDTVTTTILEKAYNFNSGAQTPANTRDKTIADPTLISGATPFGWASATTKVWHQGTAMLITGKKTIDGVADMDTTCPKGAKCVDVGSPAKPFAPLTPDNSTSFYYNAQSSAAETADETKIYKVYIRVKVCDPSVGVESNCTAYGSNYKPEGLMQAYSSKLRFSAFGYLNLPEYDKKKQRDGGVMRARMKYVGPNKTVPGSTPVANPNAEWDANTGRFVSNPDRTDADKTVSTFKLSGALDSGVVNYLNKFGSTLGDYKSFDPVSELYYAGLRYYKNEGNLEGYTKGTDDKNADGFPVITDWDDPILYSCQKNFILGIGDVNTHTDRNFEGATGRTSNEGSARAPTITSKDVTEATNMVGKLEGISDLADAAPNKDKSNSFYIAGLAYDAHTVDFRADLEGKQNISTYWLDVWEYGKYKDKTQNMYWLAAKYGGFTPPEGFSPYSNNNSRDTLKDDDWYTNLEMLEGTDKRPDNYFAASHADKMIEGLQAAFEKIASETEDSASTALSTASPNVTTDGAVSYSASYNEGNWTGQVDATKVTFEGDGTPTTERKWSAQALLDARDVNQRKIVTCCTSAGAALPFTFSSLSGATLSSRTNYSTFANVPGVASTPESVGNYIKYLRGDRAQERKNGGAYRSRGHLLGDIINSKPVAVGVPAFPYHDNYNPGYSAFKQAHNNSAYRRKTVVYVGANDGMLHAFDGSIDESTSGQELFAYVPSFVYGDSKTAGTSGLASLGKSAYSHRYFVDSTPAYFDVDFSRTKGATNSTKDGAKPPSDWRTLLIGGLGKGGKGYYAIDVTDPRTWTSELEVAGKVLWEFTDPRMGYSYGRPSVVKTKKYGWVVIFTSGYNNSDGVGYFFFVNPRNGELLEAVATPKGSVGSPLNIGEHTAYVPDYSDMTADAVYAGDLMGNVWRLDLTGNGDYGPPEAIASLTNALREAQPVTVRPLVEMDPSSKKRYVLIGTGKLLADSDRRNSSVQSFYAIVDGTGAYGKFYTKSTLPTGISFPIDSRSLEPNKNLLEGIGSKPASPMGWYFDLPTSNGIAQRVNVTPTANRGIVAFVANLPDGEICLPGGSGTVYAATFTDGQTVLVDSDGGALVASTTPVLIGGILTEVAINRVNGKLRLYVGGGDAKGKPVIGKAPANLSTAGGLKQLDWRGVTAAD
jgi:type IV pilus assembly protein PilY1